MEQKNVEISIFPLSKPETVQGSQFNIMKFYADIITMNEEDISKLTDLDTNYSRVQDLSFRIR